MARYCHLYLTADLHGACELPRSVKWDRDRAWELAPVGYTLDLKPNYKGEKKAAQNIMKFDDTELFFMI